MHIWKSFNNIIIIIFFCSRICERKLSSCAYLMITVNVVMVLYLFMLSFTFSAYKPWLIDRNDIWPVKKLVPVILRVSVCNSWKSWKSPGIWFPSWKSPGILLVLATPPDNCQLKLHAVGKSLGKLLEYSRNKAKKTTWNFFGKSPGKLFSWICRHLIWR